jgi:hypothetical protein
VTTQAARTAPKRKSRNVALTALRVSGRVIFERVARPMAHTLEDVPCSPYAITPEWLTAAICAKTPDAIVTSVLVERSSAGTHERHRLHVTYNQAGSQAGLPPSIFTKSLPSIVTRMIAGFNGHARIEGRFYSEVRPLLEIEAPVCYYSTHDRETFAAIHLLEDLVATKSATFCGHKTYVSRAMAENMIDLLATLHGWFYGKLAGNEQFRWLADYPKWFRIGAQKMRTEYYTGKAFDAAAHVIPPRLMARRQEIWPRRCARSPHTRMSRAHSCIRMCTSAIGIRPVRAAWGFATGSAPRAGIGRATSRMRSAPRSHPTTAGAGNAIC